MSRDVKHPWGRAQLSEGIHRWHRAEGEEDPRGRRARRGQVGTEAAGEMQAGKAEECRAHVLKRRASFRALLSRIRSSMAATSHTWLRSA